MLPEGPGVVVVVVMGCLGGARSSRAFTVPATWGSPRSSRMCRGRHNWLYEHRHHRGRRTGWTKRKHNGKVGQWMANKMNGQNNSNHGNIRQNQLKWGNEVMRREKVRTGTEWQQQFDMEISKMLVEPQFYLSFVVTGHITEQIWEQGLLLWLHPVLEMTKKNQTQRWPSGA